MDAGRSPLRRLLEYARPHRARMRRAAAWSVLNKVFDLAPPLLIGVAVDLVVERENSLLAGWGLETVTSQLLALSGLTFVIWAAESVFEYLHKLGWRNLAQDLEHDRARWLHLVLHTLQQICSSAFQLTLTLVQDWQVVRFASQ